MSAIDRTLVGDYDEQRRRVRLRAATTKTRKALWIELHPVLAEAIEETLGPREDRDLDARLFDASGADALRTAIAKACKAAGSHCGRRTTSGTAGYRSFISEECRGLASASTSVSGTSPSPRTPTRTFSPTRPSWITPACLRELDRKVPPPLPHGAAEGAN